MTQPPPPPDLDVRSKLMTILRLVAVHGRTEHGEAVAASCGLEEGDLVKLLGLSDWPAVMAAHALVEAALDAALSAATGQTPKSRFKDRVAQAVSLKLLTRPMAIQIRLLADIRNYRAAHTATAPLRFALAEVLADRDLGDRFKQCMPPITDDPADAKLAIWFVAILAVFGLVVRVQLPPTTSDGVMLT